MEKKLANKFSDLTAADLEAAADYFGTETEGPKDLLVSDLVENGVTWEQYHDAFIKPILEAEDKARVEASKENVVTVETVAPKEEVIVTQVQEVVTADPAAVLAQANYLIKMERQNPSFEFGTYKFTTENPYAIMPAEDAQRILSTEEGFRQAYPAELKEYYS